MENTSTRVTRVVAAKHKELVRRGSDNPEKHATNGVGKMLPKQGC